MESDKQMLLDKYILVQTKVLELINNALAQQPMFISFKYTGGMINISHVANSMILMKNFHETFQMKGIIEMKALYEKQLGIIKKYNLETLSNKKLRVNTYSELQKNVEEILKENGFEFEPEYKLDTFSIDYYLPKEEIFIECLGPTHYLRYTDQVNGRTNLRNFIITNKNCDKKVVYVKGNE